MKVVGVGSSCSRNRMVALRKASEQTTIVEDRQFRRRSLIFLKYVQTEKLARQRPCL